MELSACKSQLEKLQTLVGPAGNVEVRDLVERLRITEEKVKVLEAQLVGEEHVRLPSCKFKVRELTPWWI